MLSLVISGSSFSLLYVLRSLVLNSNWLDMAVHFVFSSSIFSISMLWCCHSLRLASWHSKDSFCIVTNVSISVSTLGVFFFFKFSFNLFLLSDFLFEIQGVLSTIFHGVFRPTTSLDTAVTSGRALNALDEMLSASWKSA